MWNLGRKLRRIFLLMKVIGEAHWVFECHLLSFRVTDGLQRDMRGANRRQCDSDWFILAWSSSKWMNSWFMIKFIAFLNIVYMYIKHQKVKECRYSLILKRDHVENLSICSQKYAIRHGWKTSSRPLVETWYD